MEAPIISDLGKLPSLKKQLQASQTASFFAQFPHQLNARVASKLVWIYNTLGISSMQVSKWGNSLAVRLPAAVVEALDLKEGDEIEISVASKRDFKVARDRSKERALEQLRQMKWSFPPDFKFNRDEINER
jgi:antitoxin MazE